jgi:hypothetical protein
MNLVIPLRLIVGSICFLYLILPLAFVSSIRVVMGLDPITTSDYLIGALYSTWTFLIVFLVPREIVIRSEDLEIHRTSAWVLAWLSILASIFVFVSAMHNVETLIYFNKTAAHTAYEELNTEYGLRLKYNILLCLFLPSSIVTGMRGWGVLFFLAPTVFEVLFSKHNYATHLLIYLFILAWNSRISRRTMLITFSFIVTLLLGIRFTLYSSFQNNAMQSLAAMLGEFTISWQSIPTALTFSGSTYTGPSEWYSDILSRAAGLGYGLAGNPVAEAIFYFRNGALFVLVGAALGFVLMCRASRNSTVGSVAMLVTTYYMRDCFRTGWSLGFSVYLKSVILFTIILLASRALQWTAASRQLRSSMTLERHP